MGLHGPAWWWSDVGSGAWLAEYLGEYWWAALLTSLPLLALTWWIAGGLRPHWGLVEQGLELRRGGLRRLLPWAWVRALQRHGDAIEILYDEPQRGPQTLRLGRQTPHRLAIAEAVEAHLGAHSATEPLPGDELVALLGSQRLALWAVQPLTQTGLPVLLLSMAAGAAMYFAYGVTVAPAEYWYQGLPPDAALVVGAWLGLRLAALPALLLSLPLLAVAGPDGLRLWGLTRWGARRSWQELQSVEKLLFGCRLQTAQETLLFLSQFDEPHQLRRAAEPVVAARGEGRLMGPAGDVPAGALSRAVPAAGTAERGLSRVR